MGTAQQRVGPTRVGTPAPHMLLQEEMGRLPLCGITGEALASSERLSAARYDEARVIPQSGTRPT